MKSNRYLATLLLVCGSIIFTGCAEDPIRPKTGFVLVTVTDASGPLVADIEIRIVPAGLVLLTDAEGVALFEVVAGDYFVEANVCCLGPGLINYHVPVTVTDGETEIVNLQSCFVCL